jgi:hypothetical protein
MDVHSSRKAIIIKGKKELGVEEVTIESRRVLGDLK